MTSKHLDMSFGLCVLTAAILFLLALSGCASTGSSPPEATVVQGEAKLREQGGTWYTQVRVNGFPLDCMLDSGSAEMSIPEDALRSLGLSEKDRLPGGIFSMADGSIVQGSRIMLREVEVGGMAIKNVPASIVPGSGSPLLGQSFLKRLQSWTLDNSRHVLHLNRMSAR